MTSPVKPDPRQHAAAAVTWSERKEPRKFPRNQAAIERAVSETALSRHAERTNAIEELPSADLFRPPVVPIQTNKPVNLAAESFKGAQSVSSKSHPSEGRTNLPAHQRKQQVTPPQVFRRNARKVPKK